MSPATLIDSHCHLDSDYGGIFADELARRAREAGVSPLFTIGCDVPTSRAAQAISDRLDDVYHAVGYHPHEASKFEGPTTIDELRVLAAHPKCRAIGEIGLDYYYKHATPEEQIPALEACLELAIELQLPVVIHARDAETDLLPILKKYAARAARELPHPGALHCFTGTQAFGQACLDLGFLVSFSGILTFKNADDLRTCAQAFPLERLMVETDSPYLAPIPHRGQKCEPSMVRLTALKLAEIKGVSFEEIARATSENARRFFRI